MMTLCLNHRHHGLDVPRANQPTFLDWVEFHLRFLKENKMRILKYLHKTPCTDLLSTQKLDLRFSVVLRANVVVVS